MSCSFTSFLNELISLTIVIESFRLFHSVDALYEIDFRSMSVRGRGVTNLLLPLSEYVLFLCFRSLFVLPAKNMSWYAKVASLYYVQLQGLLLLWSCFNLYLAAIPPSDLKAAKTDKAFVIIKWKEPAKLGSSIQGYKVRLN